jgi:hypothetical protein
VLLTCEITIAGYAKRREIDGYMIARILTGIFVQDNNCDDGKNQKEM